MKEVDAVVQKNANLIELQTSPIKGILRYAVMSKVFEFVLFEKLEPFLNICHNRFGYKKGHGTKLSVCTLKFLVRDIGGSNLEFPVFTMNK